MQSLRLIDQRRRGRRSFVETLHSQLSNSSDRRSRIAEFRSAHRLMKSFRSSGGKRSAIRFFEDECASLFRASQSLWKSLASAGVSSKYSFAASILCLRGVLSRMVSRKFFCVGSKIDSVNIQLRFRSTSKKSMSNSPTITRSSFLSSISLSLRSRASSISSISVI